MKRSQKDYRLRTRWEYSSHFKYYSSRPYVGFGGGGRELKPELVIENRDKELCEERRHLHFSKCLPHSSHFIITLSRSLPTKINSCIRLLASSRNKATMASFFRMTSSPLLLASIALLAPHAAIAAEYGVDVVCLLTLLVIFLWVAGGIFAPRLISLLLSLGSPFLWQSIQSYPMHSAEVPTDGPLGDRQTIYQNLINGCQEEYGKKGFRCWQNEQDRIEMSLRQPQSMVNYTKMVGLLFAFIFVNISFKHVCLHTVTCFSDIYNHYRDSPKSGHLTKFIPFWRNFGIITEIVPRRNHGQ